MFPNMELPGDLEDVSAVEVHPVRCPLTPSDLVAFSAKVQPLYLLDSAEAYLPCLCQALVAIDEIYTARFIKINEYSNTFSSRNESARESFQSFQRASVKCSFNVPFFIFIHNISCVII